MKLVDEYLFMGDVAKWLHLKVLNSLFFIA